VIALIDYGAGNLRSVHRALDRIGADVRATANPADLREADKIVLPGVGAFGDCMSSLDSSGMTEAVREAVTSGTPFLGICVGMQVLFQVGFEMGEHRGLGLLPGKVVRFEFDRLSAGATTPAALKIPHTGWNQVIPTDAGMLLNGHEPGFWAYFNHAYYCKARPENTLAVSEYGIIFPAAVQKDSVCGVQFHPEKSGRVGLRLLRSFVEGLS
jgi:glutamine amidotransferase